MKLNVRFLAISASLSFILAGCVANPQQNMPISGVYSAQIQQLQHGALKIHWQTLEQGFRTLATQADIASLNLILSGDPVNAVNGGQALNLNLAFASGGQSISNIPEGLVSVTATALDAQGQVLGSVTVNDIVIVAGQTANVALNIQLADSIVVNEVTNTGHLGLNLNVSDGQEIIQDEIVSPVGGYLIVNGNPAAPPPPVAPPEGEPAFDYADCELPPPPPPEVAEQLAQLDANAAAALQNMGNLSFLEAHGLLLQLSQAYPDLFPPPPELPADGSCPAPPPEGQTPAPPVN